MFISCEACDNRHRTTSLSLCSNNTHCASLLRDIFHFFFFFLDCATNRERHIFIFDQFFSLPWYIVLKEDKGNGSSILAAPDRCTAHCQPWQDLRWTTTNSEIIAGDFGWVFLYWVSLSPGFWHSSNGFVDCSFGTRVITFNWVNLVFFISASINWLCGLMTF